MKITSFFSIFRIVGIYLTVLLGLNMSSLAQDFISIDSTTIEPNFSTNCTQIIGDTMFMGGSFNYFGYRTGSFVPVNIQTGQLRNRPLPQVSGHVIAAVEDGNGGWFIAGNFTHVGKVKQSYLAHLKSDFTLDTTWKPTFFRDNDREILIASIARYQNKLYIYGTFDKVNGIDRNNFVCLNTTNGQPTEWTLTLAPFNNINGLKVLKDKLYIFGGFFEVNSFPRNSLAVFDAATGDILPEFLSTDGGFFTIEQDSNTIWVAGVFNTINGQNRQNLAQINLSTGEVLPFSAQFDSPVFALHINNSSVYVSGLFQNVNGQQRTRAAKFNKVTGTLLQWNPRLSNGARIIMSNTNGKIYLGGYFNYVNSEERNHFAIVDSLNGNLDTLVIHTGHEVYGINYLSSSNELLIYGRFNSIGGEIRENFAALNLRTMRLLPHKIRVEARNTTGSFKSIKSLKVVGRKVFFCGDFTHINNQERYTVACYDLNTSSLSDWNPEANHPVLSIESYKDKIYFGGDFSVFNSSLVAGFMASDTNGNRLIFYNYPIRGRIKGMKVHNGKLYAFGEISQTHNWLIYSTAKVDLNTNRLISTWRHSMNGSVHGLQTHNNKVLVYGDFSTINGVEQRRIAMLDTGSGNVLNWKPELNDAVTTTAFSPHLMLMAGSFSSVNNINQNGVSFIYPDRNEVKIYNDNVNFLQGERIKNFYSNAEVWNNKLFLFGYISRVGNINKQGLAVLSFSACPTDVPTITRISSPNAPCIGDSVILEASASSGYVWSNGATSRRIAVYTPGEYTVRSARDLCVSVTANAYTVDFLPQPDSGFSRVGINLVANQSGLNYAWYFNGSLLPNVNGPICPITEDGFYRLEVVDPNTQCSNTSSARFISVSSTTLGLNNNIKFYPNPANERVFVKGHEGSFEYQILNSLGQIMQTGNSEGEILINKLPAGPYLLRTTQNNQTLTQRFVKL